jgi:HEAT repeat protein
MQPQDIKRMALAAGSAVAAGGTALAAEVDSSAVDKAFETLKTYDWGADRNQLNPIDDAIVATQGDGDARKELETRLLDTLKSGVSRSAEDFILRKLRTVGTAASVPDLAAMLADEDLSHMARYALERISAPEAAAALRDAVPKLKGKLKVGAIGSLGVRRDADSVSAIAGSLGDQDKAVASAAAHALGLIGTPEAGKALGPWVKKAPADLKRAIADACLTCAERLVAAGKKADAILLYKSLSGEDQPKHVRLAATRGLVTAAGN